MEEAFSVRTRSFAVFRDPNGSLFWSDYDGQKVRAAFPSQDGNRCIVLLDPDATRKPRFENLFAVDRDGNVVWKANLPETHDAFLDAQLDSEGLSVWSWSCYRLLLDPSDGRTISQVFTK
jgi:hypothetical protein